jgi:hypothetical protein
MQNNLVGSGWPANSGLPPDVVEELQRSGNCAASESHGGALELVGLGDLTETFLTGTPILDDVGALVQIENNTFRWLVDGVWQNPVNWQPADRGHVIQGGAACRFKGPVIIEGPIFAWNVSGSGATEDITNATLDNVTGAGGDHVLVRDVSDNNTLKYVTLSSIGGTYTADEIWIEESSSQFNHLAPFTATTTGTTTNYYVGAMGCGIAIDECGHLMGWWGDDGTWYSPFGFSEPSGGVPAWNSGITTY